MLTDQNTLENATEQQIADGSDSDEIQWIRVEEPEETIDDDLKPTVPESGGILEGSSNEFNVSEYETKLHEEAKETIALLSDLCRKTDVLAQQQRETAEKLEKEKELRQQQVAAAAAAVKLAQASSPFRTRLDDPDVSVQKSTSNEFIDETAPRIDWSNIDSIQIGRGALKEPSCAYILPNLTIFVVDRQLGLFLFSFNSVLLRNVCNENWKWYEGAAFDSAYIYVSLTHRIEEDSSWKRYILKFDHNLNYIGKVEGPKWICEETVTTERISIGPDGYIYLLVSGSSFSGLYELSPDSKWTELVYKRTQNYSDMQVFAHIDPVTEIMMVDRQRGYVHMFSIGRSSVFSKRTISTVEKPVALAVDDVNRFFIADMHQSKVREVETRLAFQPIRDIALLEHIPYTISAYKGFLTVTYRKDNYIKIYKYNSSN